jgi:hypothetical protein
MGRINPEVQRLEREVEFLNKQNVMYQNIINRMKSDPGECPVNGCSDHSCAIEPKHGVGTNGGCNCTDRALRVAVQFYKRLNLFRLDTIDIQKNENAKLRDDNIRLENLLYEATHGDNNV